MISVDDAKGIILESVDTLGCEDIDIGLALNRVLYGNIISFHNIPSSDLSAMDGYAVKSEDIEGASEGNPKLLNVVDDIPAGSLPKTKIETGKAAKIMTGAILPKGADAVVKVEDTEAFSHFVKIKKRIEPYENVIKKGENIKKGEKLLEDGRIIKPADIGILASLGIKHIKVIKKPRVGILATGNEIIDIGEELKEGKIWNTNTYTLSSQVWESYGIPIDLGIGKDTSEDISSKLEKARETDIIITSGGVSVGDYDITRDVLEDMGLFVKFHNIRMKPGKPTLFGIIEGKPFFGLAGYPVSSMVCFEVFVRPAILKAGGRKNLERPIIKAKLEEDIRKKIGMRYYLRVILKRKDENFYTRLTGSQASSNLTSMVKADGLLILDEDIDFIPKGSEVSVYLLNLDFIYQEI